MSYRPKEKIGVGGIEVWPRAKQLLAQVVDSNRLSYGPMTRRFEAGFARAHGCPFGVFCNSGTSALHLALAALRERYRWKDGDEVLVPAQTFVATANVVLHNGLKPVFVDVDPLTYNMDPAQLERRRTRRTRAVIPVHLMGLPCDMDPIMEFSRRRRLRVVEDSCETAFARYRGRVVGSFGDVGCFSTYVAHYIVTGVGGFALTRDADLAVRLRSLMNHGRDSIYIAMDDDKGARGRKLREIVSRRFSFVRVGHSFRATEMEAALGLAQLEAKRDIVRARKANAARLTEALKGLEDRIQLPTVPPDREHMFMMFPIVLRKGPKEGLVHYLEDRRIETRDIPPIINQPVYRKMFGNLDREYPVARWLNRSGFYIGCHQFLTNQQIDYIGETIRRYFKSR